MLFEIQLKVNSPLNIEQATYARDALAKDIYERVFFWIIKTVNESLEVVNLSKKLMFIFSILLCYLFQRTKAESSTVKTLNGNCVGILDIYGFEVFEHNGFVC